MAWCDQSTPRTILAAAAYAIAQEIATHTSAVSVAVTRQMLWRMLGADHPMQAHRIDSLGHREPGTLADAREGVMSFLEKRPAEFTDRVPETSRRPGHSGTSPHSRADALFRRRTRGEVKPSAGDEGYV